jgi:hypothetical protein
MQPLAAKPIISGRTFSQEGITMVDPILRAIQTYGALQGIDQQSQAAKDSREDRAFQRRMLMKQEDRADQNDAWAREQQDRARTKWKQEDHDRDQEQVIKIVAGSYQAAGNDESKFDLPGLRDALKPYHERGTLPQPYQYLFDPEVLEKEEAAVQAIVGPLREGKLPDHDTAVEAFNVLYAPHLDARAGKYGAKGLRINQIVPTPAGDGVHFGGEITRSDGSKYQAPLTMNGGTAEDGDNEVKPYSVESIFNSLAARSKGHKIARRLLMAEGKIQPQKRKVMTVGSDKAGRQLVYEDTGEMVRNVHGAIPDVGSGSGKGNPPAVIQIMNHLKDTGVAKDDQEAWQLVQTAKNDPDKFVESYVLEQIKAQDKQFIQPGGEGYKTPDQLVKEARSLQEKIRSGGDRKRQAPAAAIAALRKHPELAGEFQAKYGYLPEGF